MSSNRTQHQSPDQLRKSRDLSLEPSRPPAEIPGYSIQQFLGSGAYGEVWSATNKKTGRKVAVKFYTRRTTADVQLLASEVEKLVVLAADRYVVQLLDVGWDVEPPYYIMDYIENGSLEDRMNQSDPLPTAQAIELFQEVATGMMHLHGKGILHCDLKPGNVLLDQDGKPRVADFGQSRLSTEQASALGTLFFMAPEQADMDAIPDAGWDVYGLGALLYSMLTGKPPYYTPELAAKIEDTQEIKHRLENYRVALQSAEKPNEHRKVPGVDRLLADIIDRCIAADPKERYPSIQSVLFALQNRATVRARRPLMVLGLFGPLLLIAVMSVFGWWAFRQAVGDADTAITATAKDGNLFAAMLAARSAAEQIDEYFRVVGQLARDPAFLEAFANFDRELSQDPDLSKMRDQLADPNHNDTDRFPELKQVRKDFIANEIRLKLQPFLEDRIHDLHNEYPKAASWFVNDRSGIQVASDFQPGELKETLGKNYSYRTYFTGLDRDLKKKAGDREIYDVPEEIESRKIIDSQHLSAIFLSKASNNWKIAFSTPIMVDQEVRGVVAATADLGRFVDFPKGSQYAILVDNRTGDNKGVVLEHPLFKRFIDVEEKIPETLTRCVVDISSLKTSPTFIDPVGEHPAGKSYDRESIASLAAVTMKQFGGTPLEERRPDDDRRETGLHVVAIEDYESIIEPAHLLSESLGRLALLASTFLFLVALGMWFLVARMLRDSRRRLARTYSPQAESSSFVETEPVGGSAAAGRTAEPK